MTGITKNEDWAKHCAHYSRALRLVWSDVGVAYLSDGDDGSHTAPEPNDPRASRVNEKPEVGKPIDRSGGMGASDDVLNRWHEIDDKLESLLHHELLSGDLEAAGEFLDALSKVAVRGNGMTASGMDGSNPAVDINARYQDRINRMKDSLVHWEGNAADNFRITFLNDLSMSLAKYHGSLAAAWVAVNKYKSAVLALRSDVMDVFARAKKAFEEKEETDKKVTVTVLSALATAGVACSGLGVAAATATEATRAAATAQAGLAFGDALKNVGTSAAPLMIGAKTKGEAVVHAAHNLEKIVQDAETAAEKLKDTLYSVTKSLTGKNLTGVTGGDPRKREPGVRVERPAVVLDDKFDPEEFKRDDQPQGTIDRADRSELVGVPEKDHDRQRDHYIRDPADRRGENMWDGFIKGSLPPQRKPDAYEEQ
ncbi:hypothetical protein GCM10025787_07840 [Saccharopolyspora rosea]|uniref:Uncharacterized protein n=1 Tax=Saccharopolyspora rosea TaxID=524884 RepID=A0ABW3FRW8_9PSEU